jgi:UDP-N-acetyl-D-glucosamine 4,6-dehydratase
MVGDELCRPPKGIFVNLLKPSFAKRLIFFMVSDLFLFYVALQLSYALRFDFVIDPRHMVHFLNVFMVLAAFKFIYMGLFGAYRITWRFFGLGDSKRLIKAHIAAALSFITVFLLVPSFFLPMPRSVIAIDFFLSLMFTGGLRISKRILMEQLIAISGKQAVVIGVGQNAASIIRSARGGELDYIPMGIVAMLDANKNAVGTYIENVRVYDEVELESLIERYQAEAAIITGKYKSEELQALYERLRKSGINEVKLAKLLGGRYDKLEDLSIEDLLARHPKDLDKAVIASFVKGKRVFITGAGGSIGSEIARQCSRFGAAALALVDHSEFNLYSVGEEIPGAELEMFSVTDRYILDAKMAAFKPDIVIHAAAYKHVPLCEANKATAVRNNVLGTKNVIDASIAAGVEKVVIISTDKAVRPTNVMGATKRVTELYSGNVESGGTEIVAVRFGNVLGSSGSVIPKFKRQIEAGGPVTVTHPEMTRYFMLIPEACQLVLQAAAIAKGGELFILDMGEPVKIIDLARQMIRLYGKEDEVGIELCGLRPGEKLYEELLIDASEKKTQYSSIFIAGKTDYPIGKLQEDIAALLAEDDKVSALKKIVPEFDHKP